MIRVTGGSRKNRRLTGPGPGADIRPTLSRVRESLFSSLAARGAGGEFVDLFAGSGLIGIEALSRGFARAVFVDNSRRACALIRCNLQQLGLSEQAAVYEMDAVAALTMFQEKRAQFSVYFADPPYEAGLAVNTLNKLGEGYELQPGALVVIQHSKREQLPAIAGLKQLKQLSTGDTLISLFTAG